MSAVLCVRRISRCVEEKYVGRIKDGRTEIQNSRGILVRDKERVWRREGRISKSSRVEEAGTREEDDERVCAGVQESSKKKWV